MKQQPREPPSEITKSTNWSKNPISTISYNSEAFLKSTLQYLIDEKIILDYIYIKHKGEGDNFGETKPKDHIHLLIVPARSIELNKLRETFNEVDPNNDIPLGVMPFRNTQEQYFKEWLLYVIHDEDYLKQKHLKRLYHYKTDELISNNDIWLQRLVTELQQTLSDIEVMLGYIESGDEWYIVARKLKVTTSQLSHFKDTYKMLQSEFSGFEEFAIEMVNGEHDLHKFRRSVKATDETMQNEINELQEKLQRATDIIDILLKNKSNEQINMILKELNYES